MTDKLSNDLCLFSGILLVSLRRDSRGHLNFIASPSSNGCSTTFDTSMAVWHQVKQKINDGAEHLEQHTTKQAHIKTALIERWVISMSTKLHICKKIYIYLYSIYIYILFLAFVIELILLFKKKCNKTEIHTVLWQEGSNW